MNCTYLASPYHYAMVFALKIFSTDSDTPTTNSDNITLPCPKTLSFNGLQSNTKYNNIISIEWYIHLPSKRECMIDTFLTNAGSSSFNNTICKLFLHKINYK